MQHQHQQQTEKQQTPHQKLEQQNYLQVRSKETRDNQQEHFKSLGINQIIIKTT